MNDEIRSLAEEISKQNSEGMIWFLFIVKVGKKKK
jgi:hypothetical protein